MFEYRAKVVSVYDADTITVDIDLGFTAYLSKVKLRLHGIDAPEMRGPEKQAGTKARDWLRGQILGQEIRIKTYKDKKGKYGRWLAEIFPFEGDAEAKSFNQLLVENGHAEWVKY